MPMKEILPRTAGRSLFGPNAAGYEQARPGYPTWVYAELRTLGLRPGCQVLEIGPGTGQATRRLLAANPGRLVAVEPDALMAAELRRRCPDDRRLEIRVEPFEPAELTPAAFDLAVSATAFHWLDTAPALARVHHALRPGGTWAMWWNVYGDPTRPDAFQQATDALFANLPRSRTYTGPTGKVFPLEREARFADLTAAGFINPAHQAEVWSHPMTTAGVLALTETFAPVAALPDPERQAFLGELRRIMDDRFHGRVERTFLTVFYSAQKPAA